MKSPLRTAAKHGFVPPFVPPFRFVPPLWIQIRHGDGHTKPAKGKNYYLVMLLASRATSASGSMSIMESPGRAGVSGKFPRPLGRVRGGERLCCVFLCFCYGLGACAWERRTCAAQFSAVLFLGGCALKRAGFQIWPLNLGWTSNLTKSNRPRPLGACAAGLPIWISNLIGPFAH